MGRSGWMWAWLMCGLVACAPPSSSSKDADDASSDDPQDNADEGAVTWYTDVKPLMETHCVSCHQEGEVGTFSLD